MYGRDVNTRGGVFGSQGYGGGIFAGMNGMGSYEQAAAGVRGLGLLDPEGKSWNTPTYQACIGVRIQKCGEEKASRGWSDAELLDCIEKEQSVCIAQVTTSSSLTSAQVLALQKRINVALTMHGYCPISEDGKLGPITCGASAWAVSADPSIIVPGACGKSVRMGSGFLSDCPKDKTPQVPKPDETIPVDVPPPATTPPATYTPPPPPKATGISTAWMVGGILAAVAAVGAGVYYSRK